MPFLPFLIVCVSHAATAKKPPVAAAKKDTLKIEKTVPYPSGGIYVARGIYTTLAGGRHENSGEPENLYQWQGELGYFYTPWFSGGVGFKLLAGQPSDSSQVIRNRFFVLGRFHKAWPKFAGYLGIQLGVDDLNLSLTPLDTLNFQEPLRQINAGLAIDYGLGWKFSRYVAATFGQRFEASLVGEATENPEQGSINFRTLPGLTLDILELKPSLRSNVKALYIFAETQFGQLVLENRSKRTDFAWITGVSLAF